MAKNGESKPPSTTTRVGVPIQYPMLNDTNYNLWAVKMKIILRALGLWEAVESTGPVEKEKDQGALAAISQAVPDAVVMGIAKKETAKEAWGTIQQMSVGEDRVRKTRAQVLKRQFDRMIMSDSVSIVEFSQGLISVGGEIRSLGVVLSEHVVVERLFSAVPDKFLPIIGTIEQWGDLSEMSVAEAAGRLRVFEKSLKVRQSYKEEGEQLMLTRTQWEGLSLKEKKKEEGSESKEGGSKYYEKKGYTKFDKSKIKCFNCSIYGHFASEYRKPKKERVNLMEKEEEEPALLMNEIINVETTVGGSEALCLGAKVKVEENMWYLDSGASNHMTGCLEHLTNLDTTIRGTVKLGDGSAVSIGGRGTVMIKGRTGEQRVLTDVYYIPKLTTNIISLGQLEENGCRVQLEDGNLMVLDKYGRLIICVQRSKNRLYILKLDLVKSVCLRASVEDDTRKWHARYGHLNFQSLKRMCQDNLVEGLPKIECAVEVCRGCLVGKQRRLSFPQQAEFRARESLELLHGDLCGSITPPTPAGNRFFLLLVDDFSRYMWIILMKTKDKAFAAFKEVKIEIEVEKKEKVKALRTDRGYEFNSDVFVEYCKKTSIKRFLTAPYSLQQNDVVERRNHTVLGMARSMMKSMRIPAEFWGEAVTTAVYILNRATTKSLTGMTPYEAWYKRKPKVNHFRVFGCLVHVKSTSPHLSKLDDRSSLMVFLGYEKGSKAYKVYNPVTRKVHVTQDVVFEEDKVWD
jgi:transposase InsO family protein